MLIMHAWFDHNKVIFCSGVGDLIIKIMKTILLISISNSMDKQKYEKKEFLSIIKAIIFINTCKLVVRKKAC